MMVLDVQILEKDVSICRFCCSQKTTPFAFSLILYKAGPAVMNSAEPSSPQATFDVGRLVSINPSRVSSGANTFTPPG